ncbi:MAG: lipopolysaccharide heptosyltransferase I [Burkholderiales bacterium]|nr:MAG: lipopolysaccharide heptosyltransferase I [Burkholderiales bacterium]
MFAALIEESALKLLIVKTSSMGDVVHTMPAISDIAKHRPDVEIHWMVESSFASLPAMHPAVQRVHVISWRKWRKKLLQSDTRDAIKRARAELRSTYYDLIIDAQGLVKSAFFAGQARGLRAGYDWKSAREGFASVWYQRVATVDKALHAVQRTRLLMAAHLGYRPEGAPDFSLRMPDPTWLPPHTRPAQRPFVVLIPGASRPEKLWPEDRWVALAKHIASRGFEVVWLWGSKEEGSRCVKLAAQSDGEIPPFLSVEDASALLARARAVVGLDTGFSHIAAAFGVPTVGIYCDHEPGLVGITGPGFVASVGGRDQMPELERIKKLADEALTHSTVRRVIK